MNCELYLLSEIEFGEHSFAKVFSNWRVSIVYFHKMFHHFRSILILAKLFSACLGYELNATAMSVFTDSCFLLSKSHMLNVYRLKGRYEACYLHESA